jgi:CheY-like chemotaxis protein
MPGLGGIPTIKMIRQQIPKPLADCPIILLLSTSEDEAVQTAVSKLKIRYTLEKPVKADELLGLLKIIDSNEEPGAGAEEAIFTSKIQTLHFEQIPRILIAEDNALNLALLKEMIFQQIPQAQIIAATDGLEAVYKVNELSPHLVLMDVQMPNLDGVNASIEIRKFSDLPIIAITAGALKEERERCQKAEMNGFLSKPVSVGELRDVLTSYLPFSQTAAPQEQNSLGTGNNKEHFNKAALLKNISGDTVILGSLLKTVLASFPDKIKCIKQALQQDDAEQIKAALHALRGTAQNMYFTLLGQRIGSLEQSFTGISAEERQESYQKIKAEWHIVRELINSELSN